MSQPVEVLERWHETLDRTDAPRPAVIGRWLMRSGSVLSLAAMPFSLALMHAGLGIAGLGALLARPPIHRLPGFALAAAFAGWLVLSVLVNGQRLSNLGPAYVWLALYLGMGVFRHARTRNLALSLLLVTASAATLIGIAQFIIGQGDDHPLLAKLHIDPAGPRRQAAKGALPTHLHHGFAMAMAALALWYALPPGARWQRRIGVLVTLGGVISSASRAALAGLMTGIALAETSNGWRRALRAGVVLGLLAVASLGGLIATNPERVQRMLRFEDGRWPIWRVSAAIASERPWFGTGGTKTFRARYAELYPRLVPDIPDEFVARGGAGAPHAHNSFLALAAEHGVPAALLHLALLAWLAVAAWRARDRLGPGTRLVLAAIAAAMVGGLFENYAGNSTAIYALWLPVALGFSLRAADSTVVQTADP